MALYSITKVTIPNQTNIRCDRIETVSGWLYTFGVLRDKAQTASDACHVPDPTHAPPPEVLWTELSLSAIEKRSQRCYIMSVTGGKIYITLCPVGGQNDATIAVDYVSDT